MNIRDKNQIIYKTLSKKKRKGKKRFKILFNGCVFIRTSEHCLYQMRCIMISFDIHDRNYLLQIVVVGEKINPQIRYHH